MWQYNYSGSSSELYHYGIPGMKWGHRKARPTVSIGRRSKRTAQTVDKSSPEHQAKVARRKKAIKVGAAVVGTALAAYGTYKLAKYVQNTRNTAAMKKAQDYLDQNFFDKQGARRFADGSMKTYYKNGSGTTLTVGARGSKALGQTNARTMATARQMYKDATSTKLDRGLAKVVNAGDSVGKAANRAATATGNAAKRAATATSNAAKRTAASVGNTAKSAAKTTKNRVLDVVAPQYEYMREDGARKFIVARPDQVFRRRVRRGG